MEKTTLWRDEAVTAGRTRMDESASAAGGQNCAAWEWYLQELGGFRMTGRGRCAIGIRSRQHRGTTKRLDSLLTFEIHERGDGKGRRRASKDQRVKLTKLFLL